MPRQLRNYNQEEKEGFQKLFESKENKTDRIYESIACKMYRHEYCLIGNDLVEDVVKWFEKCGLKVNIKESCSIQTEIVLI